MILSRANALSAVGKAVVELPPKGIISFSFVFSEPLAQLVEHRPFKAAVPSSILGRLI